MKKNIPLLFFLCFYTVFYSQTKLPFIGKKYFNFVGGKGEQMAIIIKKDGTVIVQSATGNEKNGIPVVYYRGKYKPIFNGYKIEGKYIYEVDKNGIPLTGCNYVNNDICKAELY